MKTDALPFNAFRKTPLDTLKNPLFSLEEMVKDNFWRMQMITIPIVSIRYVPENILKNHRDIWRKDDLIAYQPLSESFLSTEIINLRNNDEVEVFIDFLGSQTSAISIERRGTATEMSCGNT